MTPVWGHSKAVADFVDSLTGEPGRGFGPSEALGIIDNDGKLVAGVVFHDWHPEFRRIEISGAAISGHWLTRSIAAQVGEYAFDRLGCQMVVFRTDEDNTRARRLCRALGGDEYVIPRMRGEDRAEVLITLTAEAWRASRMRGQDG